jgi:tight adherence protein B
MGAEALVAVLAAASVGLVGAAIGDRALVADGRSPAGGNGSAAGPRGSPRAVTAWRRRRDSRGDLLQHQLTDAMAAIAAGTRSGLSLTQAIDLASRQVPDPVGAALREVADRTRLGDPLDDALQRWARETAQPDVRLAASVLRLHHRSGGDPSPALEGLARTLRERRAAARDVRSLTAQARLSGAILGLLPVGFFVFLWLTSRRDMMIALGSPFGRTAIMVGLVLEGAAFLWIRRLLRVEP